MPAERGRGRKRRARRRVPRSFWVGLALGVGLTGGAASLVFLGSRRLPEPPLAPPGVVAKQTVVAPEAAVRRPRAASVVETPRIAVVIDDLGDSLATGREVLALEPAVTVAVIPFRPASGAIAAAAVEAGREVILHLPLEPEDAGEMGGARGFLRTGMRGATLEQQLDADLAGVPYIVGVNGHMGSRFTSDPAAMATLLGALRARGLFFLDSRTSPGSVAAETAARLGVRFGERSVFLDHDPAPSAVERQLDELAIVARRDGQAIGIGHPHRSTLRALAAWLPAARQQGIHVVPASALVR